MYEKWKDGTLEKWKSVKLKPVEGLDSMPSSKSLKGTVFN